ncbi:MAG: hypothetical protein G01um101456_601 [Parcubacteria group bacterium Gr01-1014_56]|nr:MAG: hypothetical protein G01um101456_601 [Parcubacteria group bacterium Gr01-1014_56]
MKNKTLRDFTKEVVATFKNYQKIGTPPWDHMIAARDLPYQVGSLTKLLLQLEGIRHREGKTEKEIKTKIADELADIFAEVLFIAHGLDISIEEAWEAMLHSDQKKISERKLK